MAQSVKILACILVVPGSYISRNTNFLISNLRLVPNVLFFLLDDSPQPDIYVPTFPNTLFNPHIECFETSEHKIQTPENTTGLHIFPRHLGICEVVA